MSISIDVAGTAIPTDASQVKSLQSDEALLFSLRAAWFSVLDLTLNTIPAGFVAEDVKYTGPAVSFPLGPVTFGLQANAEASLSLYTSGTLLSFKDGLEQPLQENVPVLPGMAYLALTLNLNFSGNATFTYSGGAYGVNSELDATRTYAVSFNKAFAPSTPVRQALAAVSSRSFCRCTRRCSSTWKKAITCYTSSTVTCTSRSVPMVASTPLYMQASLLLTYRDARFASCEFRCWGEAGD